MIVDIRASKVSIEMMKGRGELNVLIGTRGRSKKNSKSRDML